MQRLKLTKDPDYRENQKWCQQNWQEKNPDYHSRYSTGHAGNEEKERGAVHKIFALYFACIFDETELILKKLEEREKMSRLAQKAI